MFVRGLQDSALVLIALGEIGADGVIQLVGAHDVVVVPGFKNGSHDFFDVIEILLGFERVVDAVVALLVEFLVGDFRIGAEVRSPGGLDQSVGHQSAGGDDGVHDASVDQLGHDHGSGQCHDDKSVFVERHGLENVGGLAELAPGEGGLGHCAHQAVDRVDLGEIERLQRNQAVFDGIVQMTVFALTAWRISLPVLRMVLRVAVIVVLHCEPPSRLQIFPTGYFTGMV